MIEFRSLPCGVGYLPNTKIRPHSGRASWMSEEEMETAKDVLRNLADLVGGTFYITRGRGELEWRKG